MKIVSWNCAGALRNKTDQVDSLSADLLIIQECEDPSLSTEKYRNWCGNYLWVGTSKNKGLGVFPRKDNQVTALEWFGNYSIKGGDNRDLLLSWDSSEPQVFLPFRLNGKYDMLGVWAKGNSKDPFSYIGQVWKYLVAVSSDINETLIITGDFNSNAKWNKVDCFWDHNNVVKLLSRHKLKSIYHYQHGHKHGEEHDETFFMHRKKEKAYHIDYAFMSEKVIDKSKIAIGAYEEWINYSDHMPLILSVPCMD